MSRSASNAPRRRHHPPWRRRARATCTAALAAGSVLAASGCGSASVSSVVDPVARASTVSNAAAGFRMTMSMVISSASLPSAITADGSGRFSPAQHSGSLNLVMHLGSLPGVAQVLGGSDLNMQEVIQGGTVYVKLPAALAGKIPGGKPWLKLDLDKLAQSSGLSGVASLLSNPTSGNPAQMLQYLRASSGGVSKTGEQMLGGRHTTEYRARVDLDKYPDLLPAAERPAARRAIAQLQALTKLHSFPVTVWIDDRHLVRQMQLAFDEQLPTSGQALKLQMTVRLPQYGPQPAPTLPPASQVTDLASLIPSHP